jgi:hypothetical protein
MKTLSRAIFLQMMYEFSSPMTIPMGFRRFGPMKIAVAMPMILLPRKLYLSRGRPTQMHHLILKFSFPFYIFPNLGTEGQFKTKFLFYVDVKMSTNCASYLKEAQTTAFCTPPIEKKIYNYNSDF